MPSDHVIHVSDTDFKVEVLAYSSQRPVIVNFWAEWSEPSRALNLILEKLADEGAGAFRLAKLDVDANPKIAKDYAVKAIPVVKVFRHAQVVSEFSGPRTELQVREFLKALEQQPTDLSVGRALNLLSAEDWAGGEELFREALQSNPDHPAALLGLARSLLAQGQATLALPVLREFPVSKEYSAAEQLLPLAQAMADLELGELEPDSDQDLAAVYVNALRLAGRGQILSAMDGLLDLIREDKKYRDGEPRRVMLGLLQVLGDQNENTREYRAELARLLF